MREPIDHDNSLYEIIILNESEAIIFQRDKKNDQQLCKTIDSENNKQVILVIPTN